MYIYTQLDQQNCKRVDRYFAPATFQSLASSLIILVHVDSLHWYSWKFVHFIPSTLPIKPFLSTQWTRTTLLHHLRTFSPRIQLPGSRLDTPIHVAVPSHNHIVKWQSWSRCKPDSDNWQQKGQFPKFCQPPAAKQSDFQTLFCKTN